MSESPGDTTVLSKAGHVIGVVAIVAAAAACTSTVHQDRAACPADVRPGAPGAAEAHGGSGHHGHHPRPGHRHRHAHQGRTSLGPTCNVVELVSPVDSTYRPEVTDASRADRATARSLLRDVNRFCEATSAAEVMRDWLPGDTTPAKPTHFFNPDRRGSLGLDPRSPRAVLVYRGRIGGVMFTGLPLPALGSIPRVHTHDPAGSREMVHVYCTPNLAEAFTPNRQLGVLADTIALRQRIRPQVAQLEEHRVAALLRTVRGHVGDQLPHVDPRSVAPGLGDPALRAERETLRQALMLLSERQLRTLSALVRRGQRGG